jgi:hypothetical protein
VAGQIKSTVGGAGGGLHGADGKPLPLVAVGSHETASAVATVPAEGEGAFS